LVAAVATLHGARPLSEFTAEQLRRERTPVHFLWRERDLFGGLHFARRAVELIPNARLNEMNTCISEIVCAYLMSILDAEGEKETLLSAILFPQCKSW
jgi:hypothetical protein